MNKKSLIIVGTLLAMVLVAAILVLWLIPGGNTGTPPETTTGAPAETNSSVVSGDQTDDTTTGVDETQGDVDVVIDNREPTVGVEVEVPDNSGNNGGNNNEIDFDDLVGNG